MDVGMVRIPSYLEWRPSDAGSRSSRSGEKAEWVPLFGLQTVVRYAFTDWLEGLAILGVQNHPTNVESFTSTMPSPEVRAGPPYLIVGIGAELHVFDWLRMVPTLQWPVMRRPVAYGPIAGLGLRAVFARAADRAPTELR